MEYKDLNNEDIKNIIQKFTTFIVFEGQSYIDESKREKYVLSYLNLFSNIINQKDSDTPPKSALIDKMFKDMNSCG